MKDTTRTKALATAPQMPTFQQMVVLALAKADKDLRTLIEIRCGDEHWAEEDVDVDLAVELALTHLERMKSMSFTEYTGFDIEWFKVGAALNLGKKLFSRQDCWYRHALDRTCAMFDHIASMVEHISLNSAQ